MAENTRRRNILIAVVLLLLVAIALLLARCSCEKSGRATTSTTATPVPSPDGKSSPTNIPALPEPAEVLTPATLTAPARVTAGAVFSVAWTGPDNRGDFVTIVQSKAADADYTSYQETKLGKTLELTAPIEPGAYEVRYVTDRSKTVLGRVSVEVVAAGATIEAAPEIVLGASFSVSWTGPNNKGDFVTIVPKGAPDAHYASYADADKPSPQTLTAPSAAGEAELRYVTGQGNKVLARRPIRVVLPSVVISAPSDVIAGRTIQIGWTGPNNAGDYITVVPIQTPDGQYANYTNTATGSPLNLLMPIMVGDAELRYMTGQGNKVLARRAIRIVAAEVTLSAPAEGAAGTAVSITWTGPNNSGDYITVVTKSTPDGQYAEYALTSAGSPMSVTLPKTAGDAEIRYMTGQGNKVLAKIAIRVMP